MHSRSSEPARLAKGLTGVVIFWESRLWKRLPSMGKHTCWSLSGCILNLYVPIYWTSWLLWESAVHKSRRKKNDFLLAFCREWKWWWKKTSYDITKLIGLEISIDKNNWCWCRIALAIPGKRSHVHGPWSHIQIFSWVTCSSHRDGCKNPAS